MKEQCAVGKKPKDDNGYFEQMSKAVFGSGFKREVIEKKWPEFKKAFSNFAIDDVAKFRTPDISRLMKNEAIVRNEKKIHATVKNAQTFLEIKKSHGAFSKFLKTIRIEGEEATCSALSKQFSFMGGATSLFFLRSVGDEMPETTKKWEATQAQKSSSK